MEIEKLIIERCGQFHDREFGPLPSGFSLWYGPNEAGKSTLLDFIRVMLWGPRSRSYGRYRHQGGVSGQLWLKEGPDQLSLVRAGRTTSAKLGGQVVDSEVVASWLNNLPMNVFESLYAFGLSELQAFESLGQEEVRGRIYSAGLGTGALSVVDFEAQLTKARDAIFLPKGQKPALNQTLAQWEELREALGAHQKDWSEYQNWLKNHDVLVRRIAALERDMPELEARGRRAARLLERVPEGMRWQELRRRVDQAGLRLEDAHARAIIEAHETLEGLRHRLETYQDARAEALASLGGERHRNLMAWNEIWGPSLSAWIAALDRDGPEWETLEEAADRARTSLTAAQHGWPAALASRSRQDVPIRRRLEALHEDAEEARLAHDQGLRQAQVLAQHSDSLKDALTERPPVESLAELQALEARWKESPVSMSASSPGWTWALLLLAALALLAVALVGQGVWERGFSLLALLLVAAAVLGQARRRRDGDQQSRDAEVRQRLRLSEDTDQPQIQVALDRLKQLIPEHQQRLARIRQADEEARLAQDRIPGLREDMELKRAQLEQALEEIGMGGWHWQDARDMLDLVPTVQKLESDWREATERALKRAESVRAALEGMAPALEAWGYRTSVEPRDWRMAKQALTTIERERDRAIELEEQFQKADRQCQTAEGQHQEAENQLSVLLALRGLDTWDAFQSLSQQEQELRACEHELRQIEERWQTLDDADRVWLSQVDPTIQEAMAAELEEGQERLAGLRDERIQLESQKSALETEIRRLEEDQEASQLRQEMASLEAQAVEWAREWGRLTLLDAALKRARQVFEDERQPAILQRAEGIFAEMTDGRYRRARVLMDGSASLEVEDFRGQRFLTDQLSRGTQEQLYLAVRLAWIEEVDRRQGRTLPLLFDDILVNFDSRRAEATLKVLQQFGEGRQVLMWTCHSHIAEAAQQAGAVMWSEAVS